MPMRRDQRSSVCLRGAFALMAIMATGARAQQIAKFTADDGAHADYFGSSVSLSGDAAIVGARADDDRGDSSGSAYMFERVGGLWTQMAKLTAVDGAAEDLFGLSVSLSGDTAIVGSRTDDLGLDSGSVYIFERVGGVWTQMARLTAADGAAGDLFGSSVSVSMSGATAAFGAFRDDDLGEDSGSVYIFKNIGGIWTQVAKLTAADGEAGAAFGYSVSMSGDTTIVGASNSELGKGSAYIFREIGGVWTEIARLAADDAADWYGFGQSVSIDGDNAAVSAFVSDGSVTIGAAYVFRESGGVWRQVAKVVADDAANQDYGGRVPVAIGGGAVILGATSDDDGGYNSGSAYVFREQGGVWNQVAKVTADDASDYDYFGNSISIDGDTALVGALNAGRPTQNGAAYLFNIASPCVGDFNGDGSVNTLDVLAFLNAWAAGDPSADINGDGTVNTLDVLAFLNSWAAGC